MGTFADLRLAHVQRYLHRCPSLAYQRGGSTLVDRAFTGPLDALIEQWNATAGAAERVRRCDQDSQVSGKASVQLLGEGSGQPDEQVVEQVVLHLVTGLRAVLPGAQLEAVVGRGPDLLQARFGDMLDKTGRGEVLTAPAARGEVPLLPRCAECAAFPADGDQHRFPDDVRPDPEDLGAGALVCLDCTARSQAAGFRAHAGAARRPPVEQELWSELARQRGRGQLEQAPSDFGSLAALAPPSDLRANHLATVSADVNSLGQLCAQLGEAGRADLLPQVAAAVKTAIRSALVAGGQAVQDRLTQVADDQDLAAAAGAAAGAGAAGAAGAAGLPWRAMGVVPHWCGGDDLHVSVPAAYGWTFVTALLRGFTDGISEQLPDLAATVSTGPPTLSAALVFAHAKLPRVTSAEAAEEALTHAKSTSARARHAAAHAAPADRADLAHWCTVTWADLTQASTFEPSTAVPAADTFTLAELEAPDLLAAVAGLPRDTRARLLALAGAPGAEPDQVAAALTRLGHQDRTRDLVAAASTAELVRAVSAAHRWWRP